MALPGHHQEMVELLDQLLRAPGLVGKGLSLCPPDPALDRILVQTTEYLLQRWAQIEGVQKVSLILKETGFFTTWHRPQFNILPCLPITVGSQPIREFGKVAGATQQGIAMVGKW